jgi:hypothetical protein
MRRWPNAILLIALLAGASGCESNCERVIRQFLQESCRRDISSDAASVTQSKNCPAHPDYEIIRLKGVITCESGEHWER